MYCWKCGREIVEESEYCYKCGSKVSEYRSKNNNDEKCLNDETFLINSVMDSNNKAEYNPVVKQHNRGKRKKKLVRVIIICEIILLLVCGGLAAMIALHHGDIEFEAIEQSIVNKDFYRAKQLLETNDKVLKQDALNKIYTLIEGENSSDNAYIDLSTDQFVALLELLNLLYNNCDVSNSELKIDLLTYKSVYEYNYMQNLYKENRRADVISIYKLYNSIGETTKIKEQIEKYEGEFEEEGLYHDAIEALNLIKTFNPFYVIEFDHKIAELYSRLIAVGDNLVMALNKDGTVQLAYDQNKTTIESLEIIEEIKSWKNIKSLYGTPAGIFAIKRDGTVYGTNQIKYDFSWNFNWSEAVAGWSNIVKIVGVDDYSIIGLTEDGNVEYASALEGDSYFEYSKLSNIDDIISVDGSYILTESQDSYHISWNTEWLEKFDMNNIDGYILQYSGNEYAVFSLDYKYKIKYISSSNAFDSVNGWDDIKTLACGASHILGLDGNGKVYATGDNTQGQCNVTNWMDIVGITANKNYSLGLKSNGSLVLAGQKIDVSSIDIFK